MDWSRLSYDDPDDGFQKFIEIDDIYHFLPLPENQISETAFMEQYPGLPDEAFRAMSLVSQPNVKWSVLKKQLKQEKKQREKFNEHWERKNRNESFSVRFQ